MKWREITSLPVGVWQRVLHEAGSPLEDVAIQARAAAHPLDGLCLAMLRVESRFFTAFNANRPENNNPLNLRPSDGNGYLSFDHPIDGITAWRDRLTDPTYKGGIYRRTVTVADLIHVYAPSTDGNNEAAYVASIERDVTAWGAAPREPVMTTPARYDLRTDYARFNLTKAEAEVVLGYRFTNRIDAGGNKGRPEYIVYHIQDGITTGSLDWWANGYVVINNQRVKVTASASKMIQKDGSILTVIQDVDGPWTNGDDMSPTPAGQPLVNLPGNSNIWTLSIEFEGNEGDLPTPAQLASAVIVTREWEAKYPQLKPKARKLRHADINSVTRPRCPGDAFFAAIMAALDASEPDSVTPFPIPWKRGELGPRKLGTQPAVAYLVELTAIKDINMYVAADPKSERGPLLKTKTKVVSLGAVQGERNIWELVDTGDGLPWRVPRHAFTPKELPKP